MLKFIRSLSRDEAGVSAIEYGILAALISLAVITGATVAGTQLGSLFSTVGSQVGSANTAATKAAK